MKSVCLLTRRPGTTREAFRDYYETQHCPLGMKHFPFTKYLRYHVVVALSDRGLALGVVLLTDSCESPRKLIESLYAPA